MEPRYSYSKPVRTEDVPALENGERRTGLMCCLFNKDGVSVAARRRDWSSGDFSRVGPTATSGHSTPAPRPGRGKLFLVTGLLRPFRGPSCRLELLCTGKPSKQVLHSNLPPFPWTAGQHATPQGLAERCRVDDCHLNPGFPQVIPTFAHVLLPSPGP